MIYCVEDEKNIRELLIYTLETTGFSARGMANSKELKDALKEELPDLILLDIMLPGEDGYSILERLKASSETQNIPVIMVTAKEAEYDKVRGLEAGADDYITKPFGMMEFVFHQILKKFKFFSGQFYFFLFPVNFMSAHRQSQIITFQFFVFFLS